MKDDEEEKFDKILFEMRDETFKLSKKQQDSGIINIPVSLYRQLFDFEKEMVKIYERAGYQTKRKDDVSRALK